MTDGPVRLYYTGRGFIPGVPQRDLHDADLARLGEARIAEITAKHPTSGRAVYQKTKPASREDEETTSRPSRPAAERNEPAPAPDAGTPQAAPA